MAYANPHAVTSVGGTTYTYDNNGNETAIGSLDYTWDGATAWQAPSEAAGASPRTVTLTPGRGGQCGAKRTATRGAKALLQSGSEHLRNPIAMADLTTEHLEVARCDAELGVMIGQELRLFGLLARFMVRMYCHPEDDVVAVHRV
jgi:hypothetical protein